MKKFIPNIIEISGATAVVAGIFTINNTAGVIVGGLIAIGAAQGIRIQGNK